MPCVKSHYTNPKNVFPPKPPNPSEKGEVACHGLEWHSGPCRTLTKFWLGLESIGLGELPHEDDLTTWQNQANHTILPKFNYILKNAYGKYSSAPCMCQTGK